VVTATSEKEINHAWRFVVAAGDTYSYPDSALSVSRHLTSWHAKSLDLSDSGLRRLANRDFLKIEAKKSFVY
jgi:hypothetical protein